MSLEVAESRSGEQAAPSVAECVSDALQRWRSLIALQDVPKRLWAEYDEPSTPKVAVIDDETATGGVIQKYLADVGLARCVWTTEPRTALEFLRREQPAVVLLDLQLPGVDGLELLRQIHADARFSHVPTLALTAVDHRDTRLRALDYGAADFLIKPIDPTELIPRVRNALSVRAYQERLERQADELERLFRERTAELALSRLELIHCLGRAAEYRDNETGRHVVRVGHYVGVIARQLGIDARMVELMELAAPLHDVGKIGIPDSILRKPGTLGVDEFRIMQSHCDLGSRIFHDAVDDSSTDLVEAHPELGLSFIADYVSPVLQMASSIAVTHHERWDGTGYPKGLKGAQIPLEGRITAVADVFDALSTPRVYKPAYPLERCFEILREGRGTHFDPDVLDAFFLRLDEILGIYREYGDHGDAHAFDPKQLH